MAYPKGGRGKRAPYKTLHYRIPEPLYECFMAIANHYRRIATGGDAEQAGRFVDELEGAAAAVANVADELGTKNESPGKPDTRNTEEFVCDQLQADLLALTRKVEANERGYRSNSASRLRADLLTLTEKYKQQKPG